MSFASRIWSGLLVALIALAASVHARADEPPKLPDPYDPGPPNMIPELIDVGVNEHLGSFAAQDATFQDENGKPVRLGDYFDGKRPTLLILAYHSCKTLCSFVQKSALDAMKAISWTAGKEYQVITLSISPHDTVGIADGKRADMLASYGRGPAEQGWHFLVGNEANIKKVSDSVGWMFKLDSQGEYAHPTVVTLLTPDGKVARYLYGIEIDPNDLKLGLIEASEGRSISTVDRILLYCYHYDPQDRKYSLMATRVMRLAGALTVVVFGTVLGIAWMRERKKKNGAKNGTGGQGPTPKIAENQV